MISQRFTRKLRIARRARSFSFWIWGLWIGVPVAANAGGWMYDEVTDTVTYQAGNSGAGKAAGRDRPDSIEPLHTPAVTTAAGDQSDAATIPDGNGGMFVVWSDQRDAATTGADIYAQHVMPCGSMDPLWPANGLALTQAPGWDVFPVIAPDGAGGAFVAWWRSPLANNTAFTSDLNIYAQHVSARGVLDAGWPAGGLPVCTAPARQFIPRIASDQAGGAFVCWSDNRTGALQQSYMQHLVPQGIDPNPAWPANGLLIKTGSFPSVCGDGTGGVIVAYNEGSDVGAQRVSAAGQLLWGAAGRPVAVAPGTQRLNGFITGAVFITTTSEAQANDIVPDGQGGCLIAFTDRPVVPGPSFVSVQRLDAQGNPAAGWPVNGVRISDPAPNSNYWGRVLADGGGGAWATADGNRAFVQHLDGSGGLDLPVFTSTGLPFDFFGTLDPTPAMASDGQGGVFFVSPGVFGTAVRRVRSDFSTPFDVNGRALDLSGCDGNNCAQNLVTPQAAVSDGTSGVRICTLNTFADDDLFAMHVNSLGQVDAAEPSYVLTATAGPNGSIAPSGAQSVCDGPVTFTMTPDPGFRVADVLVDGGSVGAVSSYTLATVTANHTIEASFVLNSHTITATAGMGGMISPSGAVDVEHGGTQAFTITPDACFLIADVQVDGNSAGAAPGYTFTNVTADHTIHAEFVPNPAPLPVITSPAAGTVYAVGTPVTFTGTFTDNPGDAHTATWLFDGASLLSGSVNEAGGTVTGTYTFTAAGVYTVALRVADGCNTATATQVGGTEAMVVVYDPSAGFATGGGRVSSPAGAYPGNPGMSGTANFGFVARYRKYQAVPTGECTFKLRVASFEFESTTLDWLVLSGAKAQVHGAGEVNDAPGYTFLLTVLDGDLPGGSGIDRLRLKVTQNGSGSVVYDSSPGMPDGAAPTVAVTHGAIRIQSTGNTIYAFAPQVSALAALWTTQTAAAVRWDADVAADVSFRVFRETTGGERVEITPSPLASSAREFTDSDASAAGGAYWIQALNAENGAWFGPIVLTPRTATGFTRIPRPFVPGSEIAFGLEAPGRVTLSIFDVAGRRVRELASGTLAAGNHAIRWDGRDGAGHALASGTYLIRFGTGSGTRTGKLLLVH